MQRLIIFLSLAISITACNTTSNRSTSKKTPEAAVSLYNKSPLYDFKGNKIKFAGYLNLGERFHSLGEKKKDTVSKRKKTYVKVLLSDSTEKWIDPILFVSPAKPAVVLQEADIFSRPDIVAKTSKMYEPINFVAIVEEKGEWISVVGFNRKRKGWIKKEAVSTDRNEVAVSAFVHLEIMDKNENIIVDKIEKFLNTLPIKGTKIEQYLSNLIPTVADTAEKTSEQVLP